MEMLVLSYSTQSFLLLQSYKEKPYNFEPYYCKLTKNIWSCGLSGQCCLGLLIFYLSCFSSYLLINKDDFKFQSSEHA